MSRGVDRQAIFFDIDDRRTFGELLGETVARFGIEVHAYCLMTNHFHLLARCPQGGLSNSMQWLLSMFATHMNRRLERVGHYFGGRFVSRTVTDVEYLANIVRYIHLNPMEIDGIDLPKDYRWSSHRTYLGLRPAPQWFETRTVASWFADPSAFDRFVCAPLTVGSTPLIRPVDPRDLIDTIDLVLTERSAARARALMAQRRAVTLTIGEIEPQAVDDEIFTALGIRSAGARRAARHRARRLRVTDRSVAEMVARTQLFFASDLDDPKPRAA